jgi:hypothetical protein
VPGTDVKASYSIRDDSQITETDGGRRIAINFCRGHAHLSICDDFMRACDVEDWSDALVKAEDTGIIAADEGR